LSRRPATRPPPRDAGVTTSVPLRKKSPISARNSRYHKALRKKGTVEIGIRCEAAVHHQAHHPSAPCQVCQPAKGLHLDAPQLGFLAEPLGNLLQGAG